MTELEEFVMEYELEESRSDMKFSPYYIPSYYNEEKEDYAI